MSKNFASNRDDYVTSRRKTQAGGLCHYGKDYVTSRRKTQAGGLCYYGKDYVTSRRKTQAGGLCYYGKDTGRRPMLLRGNNQMNSSE